MNYAENAWDEFGSEYWVCEFCGAASGTERDEYIWNSRPIEDDLRKRIAELEALVNVSEGLYERIYEQAARIAELEAERRWIPVSERLPETDGQYIGYTNTGLVGTHWLVDGHFVVTYSCEQNWLTTPTSWILESASGGDVYVTHWMPLPESPNDTQTSTIVYGKESD
jgi:hypothetical protein